MAAGLEAWLPLSAAGTKMGERDQGAPRRSPPPSPLREGYFPRKDGDPNMFAVSRYTVGRIFRSVLLSLHALDEDAVKVYRRGAMQAFPPPIHSVPSPSLCA